MMKVKKQLPLVIGGPTASGKSKLAMEMAEKHHGLIINADSMQVYAELPILTAHPTAEEQSGIAHRLYGFLKGDDMCSAARWRTAALKTAHECWEQGMRPIFVGGTGLYLLRLTQGIAYVPHIDPSLREQTRTLLDTIGIEEFYRKTIELDPLVKNRLMPADQQRLVRAYEVMLCTGKSIFEWQEAPPLDPGLECEMLIVERPRDVLHKRAAIRFDEMLNQGAIQEVRALLEKGYASDLPVMRALGVRELAGYLSNEHTLDQARELSITATRQYIKRQQTFFRNQFPQAESVSFD